VPAAQQIGQHKQNQFSIFKFEMSYMLSKSLIMEANHRFFKVAFQMGNATLNGQWFMVSVSTEYFQAEFHQFYFIFLFFCQRKYKLSCSSSITNNL
jgi:hypothetical protein